MTLSFFQHRIHPLLYITIAYMLGIYCWHASRLPIGLGIISVGVLALWYTYTQSRSKHWYLIALGLVLAYGCGAARLHYYQAYHAAFSNYCQQQPCDVVGVVTNIAKIDHPHFRTAVTLRLNAFKHQASSTWVEQHHTIQFYIPKSPDCMVGDTISLSAITFKKEDPKAPYTAYRYKEGIAATLFSEVFTYTLIDHPAYSLRRWLFSTRQTVHDTLKQRMNPATFALFSSLFLGAKPIPKRKFEHTKEHFTTWGVTHYLARSGLHMVIFVICWQLLLSFVPLPFIIKELLMILLGIIYCLLSWPSVSFNRAFFIFLLYKICSLARIQTDFLYILTLVCCCVLLDNPMHLFFLDFQLSFGLTFAVAYFNQLQTHRHHQPHTPQSHKTVAS